MAKPILSSFGLWVLVGFAPLHAGSLSHAVDISPYPYQKRTFEVQGGAGAFFSGGGNRVNLNYATEYLRLGWMLSDIRGSGFLRGNWEGLVEGFGGEVIKGPGNGFGGAGLLGRYNFIQEQARLIPYMQIGGGGLFDDIYRDKRQRCIGSSFEFILQGGVGLRWSLNRKWAVFLEGEFQHTSNANTASRNVGVNAFGATIGFSRFF